MIFMTKYSPIACLSKAALFTDLPIELKEKLVTVSEHQQKFPKGSIIRQPDDGKDGMIVIDQGKAKVYNLSKDGKVFLSTELCSIATNFSPKLFKSFNDKSGVFCKRF